MKTGTEANPLFFRSATEYRKWLEKNHDKATELWIGFWKKGTGKPSMTWQETVDQSLCFGWIDGIRKSIDADSFKQRVTPRRATSMWSQINIKRVGELTKAGQMRPAGKAAFERRNPTRTYSGEAGKDRIGFGPKEKAQLARNKKAAEFMNAQPPGYRRLAEWFVMSARKDETRQKRLTTLIKDSAAGRRLAGLAPKKG